MSGVGLDPSSVHDPPGSTYDVHSKESPIVALIQCSSHGTRIINVEKALSAQTRQISDYRIRQRVQSSGHFLNIMI